MSARCWLLGHRWVRMVTVPGDLCLRCHVARESADARDERHEHFRELLRQLDG